jgi:hypothetical protein
MARLVSVVTSSCRSCDYSPHRRHHHARTLSGWHSCLQDVAIGPPPPGFSYNSRFPGRLFDGKGDPTPDVPDGMTVTTPPRRRRDSDEVPLSVLQWQREDGGHWTVCHPTNTNPTEDQIQPIGIKTYEDGKR